MRTALPDRRAAEKVIPFCDGRTYREQSMVPTAAMVPAHAVGRRFVHRSGNEVPHPLRRQGIALTIWRCEMESILIEIRAAEGGDDSKLLVADQLGAYVKAADRGRL